MTQTVVHISLDVRNLEESLAFYRTLFGVEPSKVKPGYAKLEPREPAVNLALNEVATAAGESRVSHFGIQVPDADAVRRAAGRLMAAGLATQPEEGVTCCYAKQDKVWVQDPDGNAWEVFAVLEDAAVHSDANRQSDLGMRCC